VAPTRFTVEVTPAAERDLKRIDRQHHRQIADGIDRLENDARPWDSQALHGEWKGYFRLTVGEYRVIYSIDYASSRIWISRIRNRKEVYRK